MLFAVHADVQGAFAQQAAPGPAMSIEQVVAQLEAEGYTEFHEIERENGRYEVLVSNTEGRTVEIYLDARTGETLKIEQVYFD